MSALSATDHCRQKVLGYPVDLVKKAGALGIIEAAWRTEMPLRIVTLNAEMVIAGQRDPKLNRIIKGAQLIIPDGAGIVWALRLAGYKVDRLPGIDVASITLGAAANHKIRVALIGSRKTVLDKLLEVLPKLHPGLNIVIAQDGYFSSEEESALVAQIAKLEPQLMLFALGVPKQEYFSDQWGYLFPKAVMMGVGGSFDVWAGITKRAPQAFQRFHLEWLYRLLQEPIRFKRMVSTLPQFAAQVLIERIRQGFKKDQQ
jgi:N-acetylglucosaminyldiphosphoundecaprenol N-acetyl-beta-D-mannosaminyltransferase